ncbi:MAG: hypothetical protein HGB28_01615 [Oscillochloris sp.]|nr:hypothetical protein [Oscillochloris sp.]
MTAPELTITNEQVNSLPLLLGIIMDMGIRDLIDTHVTPHGNWGGASVGTVIDPFARSQTWVDPTLGR